MLCLLGTVSAVSGEFGNVVGTPEVEKESRIASATALEGIELTMAGLRQRELGGTGEEQFQQASSKLQEAADQMYGVRKQLGNASLSDAQMTFLNNRADQSQYSAQIYAMFREAKTVDEIYEGFAEITTRLATILKSAADKENAFSALSPILAEYFRLADDIAALKTVQ